MNDKEKLDGIPSGFAGAFRSGAESVGGPPKSTTTLGRNNKEPKEAPLSVARAVDMNEDDPDLEDFPRALEMDPDAKQQQPAADAAQAKGEKSQSKIPFEILGIAILIFVCTAIVVGVVVGVKKNREANTVVVRATGAPTVQSASPSEVPSSAPTGSLDMLLETLPSDSLQRINGGSDTAQWKAFNWLSNHQNLTNLPEWRKMQLFAMATFFYSFEGQNWPHYIKERWMDDTLDECQWFSNGFGYFIRGIYFQFPPGLEEPPCNELGNFASLHLADLQLAGLEPSIPEEIQLLTGLEEIVLVMNGIDRRFADLVPQELYEMASITTLRISGNKLFGSLPTELGMMRYLTSLSLTHNQISGQIPTEIGLLKSMERFQVSGNALTGQLPSEIGEMSVLSALDLGLNLFSGFIPTELGMLASLEFLTMQENAFSGTLPEITMRTDLRWLNLAGNSFSGRIPPEIGSLGELWTLDLSNLSLLSGAIPPGVGLLTSLRWLDLSECSLTGTIPSEVGLISGLKSLHLQNNRLTGTLPHQLNISMGLRLDRNRFSGTVPEHLCSFLLCNCSIPSEAPVSSCSNLIDSLDWPGRFPPDDNAESDSVMLNLQTKSLQEEIVEWVWKKESNSTEEGWESVKESGDGVFAFENHLYSQLFKVARAKSYRLDVLDKRGYGIQWFTLTASNETVLFDSTDAEEERFTEVNIVISVDADGSMDTEATYECNNDPYCQIRQ